MGKCSEYVEYREEKRKEQALRAASEPAERVADKTGASKASEDLGAQGETSPSSPKKKLSFKEQKEFEQLDAAIPALEAEQKELEEKMASSDFEVARAAGERYNQIAAELEEKYARWEELAALA